MLCGNGGGRLKAFSFPDNQRKSGLIILQLKQLPPSLAHLTGSAISGKWCQIRIAAMMDKADVDKEGCSKPRRKPTIYCHRANGKCEGAHDKRNGKRNEEII